MEVESDDLLFAELTRRISLLIMDDDELPIAHTVSFTTKHSSNSNNLTQNFKFYGKAVWLDIFTIVKYLWSFRDHTLVTWHTINIMFQNFTRTVHQLRPRELPLMMDYENGFVRESKGTGVFIPARLPPRKRKQKNVTAGYRIKSENKRLNGQPSPTYYCKPK